jgi:small-conductance mechanosensitive channel
MCGWTERLASGRVGPRLALAALAFLVLAAAPATAQGQSRASAWESASSAAEKVIANEGTPTPELEALRGRLVQLRTEAQEQERAAAPNVQELNKRLAALGPAPAEGAEEAPEIATLRRDLHEQIADAQVPVLEAQQTYQRANALIDEIDGIVRSRFTAELRTQGPSPLLPRNWASTAGELSRAAADYRDRMVEAYGTPERGAAVLRRLPISMLLAAAGIAITFVVRRWIIDWVEGQLATAAGPRAIAWLVALRNLVRLIVPAVGAGLIFAALSPANLAERTERPALFVLPDFILVLIWAGWLGASLFAPRLPAFRLIKVGDAEARRGAWLTVGLGVVVALHMVLIRIVTAAELSPAAISVLNFPLVGAGSILLWQVAALVRAIEPQLAPAAGGPPDQGSSTIGLRFLKLAVRALQVTAVAAPVLAALGYFAAARFLVFPPILTLGLAGSCFVVFHLLSASLAFLLAPPGERGRDGGGLIPVVVAALVGLGAIPLLALAWGARPSDIGDLWVLLRDGVTFGGIRISAVVILKFVLVLGIGVGLTRLLQGLLRGSVLPRTKLDAGGRNAVLAGVSYAGLSLAALAAVSAAGLDLSSLAIVAGALSVGIGFGLQNIVSNFVSGIILLVERPVKEGDWIEVGGFSGYVKGIKVRSTEIETFDRASVILPNSDLIAGTVLNRTHRGASGRLQVPVGVTYDADPKRVEAILLATAEEHPLVLEDPAPRVLFLELGPDSMNFELRCWLRDVNFSLSARSDMNYEIIERFRAEGIRAHFYGRDLPATAPPEPLPVTLHRAMKES